MSRPVTLLLALLGLALLGRLDRDGVLARADVAARALGYEVRVAVKLQRTRAPIADCTDDRMAERDAVDGRRSCE
jgi:hypothetical protein